MSRCPARCLLPGCSWRASVRARTRTTTGRAELCGGRWRIAFKMGADKEGGHSVQAGHAFYHLTRASSTRTERPAEVT